MKLASPSKKVVLFGLSGVLLTVIVALLVFYGLSIWPKQQVSNDNKQTDVVSTGNVKSVMAAPVKVETSKNKLSGNKEVKLLRTHVIIETKEQGECTLTLSNENHRYTVKNSSVGVEHAVGCLQWNVSTEGMAKGDYDLVVKFQGTKDHATVSQKVTL